MGELSAKKYKARRYASGSSDFETLFVSVQDDVFHLTDAQGAEIVLPMTAVNLKLGGSGSDRVVLEVQKNGDTIIVSDLEFLSVLQKTQATSNIIKQAKRARSARAFTKMQGVMYILIGLFVVLAFGGCVFIGTILEPERASHERETTTSESESANAEQPETGESSSTRSGDTEESSSTNSGQSE